MVKFELNTVISLIYSSRDITFFDFDNFPGAIFPVLGIPFRVQTVGDALIGYLL